jgi:hypothetical protein
MLLAVACILVNLAQGEDLPEFIRDRFWVREAMARQLRSRSTSFRSLMLLIEQSICFVTG